MSISDTKASPPPKPKLKRNKTHELSFVGDSSGKAKSDDTSKSDDVDSDAPPKPALKKLRSGRSISMVWILIEYYKVISFFIH